MVLTYRGAERGFPLKQRPDGISFLNITILCTGVNHQEATSTSVPTPMYSNVRQYTQNGQLNLKSIVALAPSPVIVRNGFKMHYQTKGKWKIGFKTADSWTTVSYKLMLQLGLQHKG